MAHSYMIFGPVVLTCHSRLEKSRKRVENEPKSARAPCAVQTCAVRPVFVRMVGELRGADPSNVQGTAKQNASPEEQLESEAPRPRWKLGQEQNPGPENQDSQHMLEHPRGYFADKNPKKTQRALRDRLMSRGKNCLPTVSSQFLTRNYPRPNCLLKCLPNCLSPTREGFLSSFKISPAVRVIARQVRDKNCLAAIFAPRHQSVSSGPLGSHFDFFSGSWLIFDSFSSLSRALLTPGRRGPGKPFSDLLFFSLLSFLGRERPFWPRGHLEPCKRSTMSQDCSQQALSFLFSLSVYIYINTNKKISLSLSLSLSLSFSLSLSLALSAGPYCTTDRYRRLLAINCRSFKGQQDNGTLRGALRASEKNSENL